ncbi:phospholipid phosphatase-related protein type 5 [Hyalella azteca]|uniref:Phospholipid phosphatase-related protein type 5 n=1 Tax=Hyalella azteca TaxID=294128 RepID=A0A8B7N4Q1_HYAAZ|nr:phospholipid phosphatase-related protein type 5 [Hyalella azteca]
MMAYEQQPASSHPPSGGGKANPPSKMAVKGGSGKWVKVTRTKGGHLLQEGESLPLIPMGVAEGIVLVIMIVMNYLFRFDPKTRDASSLADYPRVTLSPSDVLPPRPYYNYSLSLADNQNNEYSFGVSFTMQEYAFFVPLFVVPLLLTLVVELVQRQFPRGHIKNVVSFDLPFPPFVRRTLRFYYVFLFYGSLAGMAAAFLKLLIPKPRPHFLAVCDGATLPGNLLFNVSSSCSTADWPALRESLRSFPSYHATLAFYAGTFLVLYLMYTCQLKGTYSSGGLLSLPVGVMAAIGGLHRWVTYHADGWDVAWGAAIGGVVALWAVSDLGE